MKKPGASQGGSESTVNGFGLRTAEASMHHRHSLSIFTALLVLAGAAHGSQQVLLRQAKTVAVGAVKRVEGTLPFTNANPPTLVLQVVRAMRGCKVGEQLRIEGFTDEVFAREFPQYHRALRPEEIETQHREWLQRPLEPPGTGTPVLILLDASGKPLTGQSFPEQGAFISPTPAQVAAVAFLTTFELGLETPDFMGGEFRSTKLRVHSVAERSERFDLSLLRASVGAIRGQGDWQPLKGGKSFTLRPGEERLVTIDLGQALDGRVEKQHRYFVRLAGPGDPEMYEWLDLFFEPTDLR